MFISAVATRPMCRGCVSTTVTAYSVLDLHPGREGVSPVSLRPLGVAEHRRGCPTHRRTGLCVTCAMSGKYPHTVSEIRILEKTGIRYPYT